MAVVIICCMILVGLFIIYAGWKRPYDEISSPPDIPLTYGYLNSSLLSLKKYLRFQQKNLCGSHSWFLGLPGTCYSL